MSAQPLALLDALLSAADAAPDLAQLLERALDAFRSATGARSAAILLLDDDLLRPTALQSCDRVELDSVPPLPASFGALGTWTRAPATAPLLRALGCPAARCLPLQAYGEPLGCLLLSSDPGGPPAPCDDALLSTAGRVLGLAIAHARLRARQPSTLPDADGMPGPWLEQCRLAAVGRLIPAVAHDLNNPLQAVTGYAQLLLTAEVLDEGVRRDLTRIQAQALRAAQIVENVLSVARPHKPERRLTDVSEALERTLELLAHPLRANSIQCTLNQPATPLLAWTDPALLHLLLLYLLNGAIDAQVQAGGRGSIAITGRNVAGVTRLEIVTGAATDAASAPALAIVERIVGLLGGRLQVSGAVTGVDLPAAPPTAGAAGRVLS